MIEINLKGSFSKSPNTDNFVGAFRVFGNNGGYVTYGYVDNEYAIRPVLYLDSDVAIADGELLTTTSNLEIGLYEHYNTAGWYE